MKDPQNKAPTNFRRSSQMLRGSEVFSLGGEGLITV